VLDGLIQYQFGLHTIEMLEYIPDLRASMGRMITALGNKYDPDDDEGA